MQELEVSALKVVEEQKKISALLEQKNADLAVIKEEFDIKKKEVDAIAVTQSISNDSSYLNQYQNLLAFCTDVFQMLIWYLTMMLSMSY